MARLKSHHRVATHQESSNQGKETDLPPFVHDVGTIVTALAQPEAAPKIPAIARSRSRLLDHLRSNCECSGQPGGRSYRASRFQRLSNSSQRCTQPDRRRTPFVLQLDVFAARYNLSKTACRPWGRSVAERERSVVAWCGWQTPTGEQPARAHSELQGRTQHVGTNAPIVEARSVWGLGFRTDTPM